MKRYLFLLTVLLMFSPLFLAAQADAYNIFSVDIGYNVLIEPNGTPIREDTMSMGFNFRLTERLTAGFELNNLVNTFLYVNALKLKADIVPLIRAVMTYYPPSIAFTDGAFSLGMELLPIRRRTGGLSTEFKFLFDFIREATFTATPDYGFRFGLVAGIGH